MASSRCGICHIKVLPLAAGEFGQDLVERGGLRRAGGRQGRATVEGSAALAGWERSRKYRMISKEKINNLDT
ncbi:hypothetical protein ACGFNU_40990 [Spirillospora sp. NPDC048911]|uniref:hypothetical protein n=1 Tax=Spirillospora sp. NPDC048911 TaxID=3364527 RepID=UPI00371057EE